MILSGNDKKCFSRCKNRLHRHLYIDKFGSQLMPYRQFVVQRQIVRIVIAVKRADIFVEIFKKTVNLVGSANRFPHRFSARLRPALHTQVQNLESQDKNQKLRETIFYFIPIHQLIVV